jgi:hypothetical protein
VDVAHGAGLQDSELSDVEQSRGRGKDGGAPKEKKSGVLSVVVVVGIVFFFC